jgi:hypothetical protein
VQLVGRAAVSAALEEARLVAGELVRDAAFASRSLDHVVEVSDTHGNVVITFRCFEPEGRCDPDPWIRSGRRWTSGWMIGDCAPAHQGSRIRCPASQRVGKFIINKTEKWGKVIRTANIKPE